MMSSKNQFCLVVDKIEQYPCTIFGKQREQDIFPGTVVVTRPCNGENEVEVHRGGRFYFAPCLATREGGLPRDKVVPITGQEFDVLLGIYDEDQPRLELHTSDRLKWVCQLKAGDDVQVKLDMRSAPVPVAGVIRGNATRLLSELTYGLQFIVEITVRPSCYHICCAYMLHGKFKVLYT